MRTRQIIYIVLVLLCNFFGWANIAFSQELYKVKSLPFNTPDKNEFSAIPFEHKLLFCSDRTDFSVIKFETTKGAKSLVSIFSVESDSSIKCESAAEFSSIYAHDGPITFYDYGNKAVLTRTQSDKNKLKSIYKDTKLGLFFFEKKNGQWKETGTFVFNDASYSCGQATINELGTVMIFSSDMPGGLGGTDLYYSAFNEDSTWTLPVNLGPVINSSKNEMFPFLHPSGILYYSSSGKKGKGGLDVFHTVGGFPYSRIVHEVDEVNSDKDDFGFWASPDFSKGYVTSNRAGTDDIYSVKLSYPEFTECVDYAEVTYCYEFFENASINIDTIPMVYEWDFGDGTTKKGLSAYHCYREPGIYTVQLNIFDTVINTLFMNEAMYELEIADFNQPLMDVPDSANPLMPFFVSSGQARFRDFEIDAYYWDFGDGMQMKGERFPVTLEKPGVYEVILGVTSVPDENGRTKTRCFRKKLVVTDNIIERPLADDSSDPANEKLPGGTRGTTYVLVEDKEGFHVTRLKGDGTNVSDINQLPNTVYYLKLDENGDTIVKKHSQDVNTRQLLEKYLESAEAPYEVKKNGLVSYNAFLPSDSTKYPVYGIDIKKFYGSIDSLVKSPWQFTLLPDNIAKALSLMNQEEGGLTFIDKPYDKKYLPKYYNTVMDSPNDSTTVFYKQTTTDPNKGSLTNTTQYDTQQSDKVKNNGNTNNVQENGQVSNNTNKNGTNQTGSNNNTRNSDKGQNNAVATNNSVDNKDTTQTNGSVNKNVGNENGQNNAVATNNQVDNKDTTQTTGNANKNIGNENGQNNAVVTNNKVDNKDTAQAVNVNKNVGNENSQNNSMATNNQVDNKDTTQTTGNANKNIGNENGQNNAVATNNQVDNKDTTQTTGNVNKNIGNDNGQNNAVVNNNQVDNKDTTQTTGNVNKNVGNEKGQNNETGQPNKNENNNSDPKNIVNNTDTTKTDTVRLFLIQLRNYANPDLSYKVQIGAYRYPANFKYEFLKKLGKAGQQLKLEDGITRFTMGEFNSLQEAYEFRDAVKRAGISDAFVTAVYQGKRYYLLELKQVLQGTLPPLNSKTL